MGNPFHDAHTGEFSSGGDAAASGDHQGAQPTNKEMRNVPGHGLVRRSKPIAMHAGRMSVGTSNGGGGGGGGRLRKKAIRGVPGGSGSEDDWSKILHEHRKAATR